MRGGDAASSPYVVAKHALVLGGVPLFRTPHAGPLDHSFLRPRVDFLST